MGKTEQHLIAEASKRGGTYSVEHISGRGAFGGRVSAGARESQALHKLVERGLARIIHRSTTVDHNRGYAVWSCVIAFELTGA